MASYDLSSLSEGQLKVVQSLEGPLFVEAGAGSGKTFTLTRRIAWALTPGSGRDGKPFLDDLSQVLVITFTDAAAREIRERVRTTLRAWGLTEAALGVDSAWISTIHGMCRRILTRHALDLGIDPDFRVATTNESEQILTLALDEVVGKAYQQATPGSGLCFLFEELGYGTSTPQGRSGVVGAVCSVIAAAHTMPGGMRDLCCPGKDDVEGAMTRLQNALEAIVAEPDATAKARDVAEDSLACLAGYFEQPRSARSADAALEALAGVRLPRSSKALASMISDAKELLAQARLEVALARMAPALPELIGLADDVQQRQQQIKLENSLLDNDDLIRMALDAVRDVPEIAREYAGRFRLVMIDEFQDTDQTQLELIGRLSAGGANLATVGDAQQSIYRFRGADVGVFRSRGRELPPECHVRLDTNYRSHADILSFVDAACGRGVVAGLMSLKPNPERKDGFVARGLPRISIEMASAAGRKSQIQTALVASQIADRLATLAKAGQQPGDMALLLGTTTHADLYIDAIRARGLDCVVTGGSTFTRTAEAKVMSALLHTLANPHDTQSGLFPLLTSEMFELDADDLVELGTRRQVVLDAPTKRPIEQGIMNLELYAGAHPSAKLARAAQVLDRAWKRMACVGVAQACLDVVRDSGWLGRLEAEGVSGRAREANVIAALGYIRDLTSDLGLGAARAAIEYDRWLTLAKVPPASLAGGRQSAVRVMTIHASKGLEFPVVAVSECWSERASASTIVSGHTQDGRMAMVLAPSGVTPEESLAGPGRPETLGEWYSCLRQEEKEADSAERGRLLYVALTRAREALVLGVTINRPKKGPLTPALASKVISCLCGEGLPPIGESRIDFGSSEPALLRRVDLIQERGNDPQIDSAASFIDGSLPTDPGAIVELASGNRDCVSKADENGLDVAVANPAMPQDSAGREITLFELEDDGLLQTVQMTSSQEGIYSYSSVAARLKQMSSDEQQAQEGSSTQASSQNKNLASDAAKQALAVRREAQEEEGGTATPADADRATGLGSAFHELAQTMAERAGRFPSEQRVAATKRRWRLSERQQSRLDAALRAWWVSPLREEAYAHEFVEAELPFFCHEEGRWGSYVEGAIDLLAYDRGSSSALLIDYKTGDRGLTPEQIYARHILQANFYATVLFERGFKQARCCFVCVEVTDSDGLPFVAEYVFTPDAPPSLEAMAPSLTA